MRKYLVLAMAFVFVLTTSAFAANMVKADEFKKWLESGKKMIIVDIQPKDEFEKHHFKDSIETNAYPAKTDEEKKRLDKTIPIIQASKDDVVIICPRGGSGASNTYDYLKSKDVPENRLYILEGGIAGWPYKEMLIKRR
ncbi:MAG: rhodanese-like domain-containing protein [Thermodesulfovibrionales bacterium]|nr:rhodanese-like domain-containing protein [Thermodesulfovibrionales bacterium]